MALPDKKTSQISKSETHPFEIPVSLETSRRSRIIVTNTICELEDGPNLSQSVLGDKLNGHVRATRTGICLALVFALVVVIVSLGSLSGLVWNILETRNQADRIDVLEKELLLQGQKIDKYESLFDAPRKEAAATATMIVPTTLPTILSSSSSSSTLSPSSQTLQTSKISETTTRRTTTAPMPTTTLQPGGFRVNQTKEVAYSGYTFLAVQLEVPSNGLSKSENWCRDYELLCKTFSRRPTGCGELHISTSITAKVCMDEYDSDMYIGNVLDCSPSEQIANIANIAFPNLATPAQKAYNAFGFHICGPQYCKKSIQDSDSSLAYIRGVWEANETLVYTVCL